MTLVVPALELQLVTHHLREAGKLPGAGDGGVAAPPPGAGAQAVRRQRHSSSRRSRMLHAAGEAGPATAGALLQAFAAASQVRRWAALLGCVAIGCPFHILEVQCSGVS